MRRDLLGEGERLDTVEGDDEGNYLDEDEKIDHEVEKIEATLDDVEDDDDNESLLNSRNNKQGGSFIGQNTFIPSQA